MPPQNVRPAGETVSRGDLVRDLRAVGVHLGQFVFVHSSLSSLGWVEGGADTVIDAFLEVLGPEGTLAMPTLVQRPTSVEERFRLWDPAHTPSDVGRITETLRLRPGARRSNHPTHSVAALGARGEALTEGHELAAPRPSPWGDRAFGGGSPWERLAQWHALYVLLGVEFDVCTLFHYVQALLGSDHLAGQAQGTPWPEFDFRQMGRACSAARHVAEGRCGAARVLLADAATLVQFAIDTFLAKSARSSG
jgi:aminoglycoside 3-N-acetyltransferase